MNYQKQEIKSLTGVRGIAALYVVIYHYYSAASKTDSGLNLGFVDTLIKHGYLAVDLFFILSGFVMALTYGNKFVSGVGIKKIGNFFYLRFARIYPLYFVVTVLTVVHDYFLRTEPVTTPPLDFPTVLSQIFLIQAWGISDSYLGQAWSISTEWFAYVVFPFLIFVTYKFNKITMPVLYLVSAAVLSLLCINVFSFSSPTSGLLDYHKGNELSPIIRCVCEFTLGVLAFRMAQVRKLPDFMTGQFFSIAVMIFILVLLLIAKSDFIIVMLLPLFILSMSKDNNIPAKICGSKIAYFFGLISYSVYLAHWMPMWGREYIQSWLEHLNVNHAYTISTILMLPATVILATVTYFTIEKPSRSLLKKAIQRK